MKDIMGALALMIIYIGATALYVINLVQLFQNHYETGMLVLKVLGGIIPPIGIIMGIIG